MLNLDSSDQITQRDLFRTKGRGELESNWSCRTTIILEALVHVLGITKRVDVAVKLEKLVCPFWTEEDHHARVDEEIEDQVDTRDSQKPMQGVSQQCEEG